MKLSKTLTLMQVVPMKLSMTITLMQVVQMFVRLILSLKTAQTLTLTSAQMLSQMSAACTRQPRPRLLPVAFTTPLFEAHGPPVLDMAEILLTCPISTAHVLEPVFAHTLPSSPRQFAQSVFWCGRH